MSCYVDLLKIVIYPTLVLTTGALALVSSHTLAAGCDRGAIRREAIMEPDQYWTVNGDGEEDSVVMEAYWQHVFQY